MFYLEVLDQLFEQLQRNTKKLDALEKIIVSLEKSGKDYDTLENYYAKEFSLCVENSGIYEDIQKYILKYEEENKEPNLRVMRIKKDSEDLLRVKIIDL